jgi:threonine synthase
LPKTIVIDELRIAPGDEIAGDGQPRARRRAAGSHTDPDLAARIMAPFVAGSLTEDELLSLCHQVYGDFGHAAVTPLVQLDAQHWLLELFHGPTLAFKDMALQLLGRLFETFLDRRDEHLTIVGATSGDTGSAAIRAVAGRKRVEIFMLHPKGRVSDVQRRQMTTVRAPNVHNLAIEGSFDDAQRHVKRMFNDADVTATLNLGAVNSINWARLMAQVVYYFYAAVRLGAPGRPIAFSVPTGNFGDVFAGYVAARMGLPIERLIVATNVNDILHRALTAGDYTAAGVTPTITPSMDIQVSSNFERLLFDACGRDGAALAAQMRRFEATMAMQLTNAQAEAAATLFASARADQVETAGAGHVQVRDHHVRQAQFGVPQVRQRLGGTQGAGAGLHKASVRQGVQGHDQRSLLRLALPPGAQSGRVGALRGVPQQVGLRHARLPAR